MKPNTYVFIAGPYMAQDGGHDAAHWYEIDAHINEARLWATKLADEGIPFFCPHMNSAHMEVFSPSATADFWYDLDMRILEHASVILMIPGWRESNGAREEAKRAEELDVTLYTYQQFEQLVQVWNGDANNG